MSHRIAEVKRSSEHCFQINHTMPISTKYQELAEELFNYTLGEELRINTPLG